MRTAWFKQSLFIGVLAIGASSCAGKADAEPELPPMVDVEPPAPTSTTTGMIDKDTTHDSIVAAQVDDCVRYVPFAAFTGNVYMQLIWNQAGQDVTRLREVCEGIAVDDPGGLARISAEQQAVDKFFAAVSSTTTV